MSPASSNDVRVNRGLYGWTIQVGEEKFQVLDSVNTHEANALRALAGALSQTLSPVDENEASLREKFQAEFSDDYLDMKQARVANLDVREFAWMVWQHAHAPQAPHKEAAPSDQDARARLNKGP